LIGYLRLPQYINLTSPEKIEILRKTSALTKISPNLLEKDFWVSWILNKIFELELSHHLIFKGGTSLSKCSGLISRFSEDIDITINKALFSGEIDDQTLSGKQFERLLKSNDQKAIDFVQNKFKTALEDAIKIHLPDQQQWQLIPDELEPKNLRFHYPRAITTQENPYIKQSVLIEIGVRGDIVPFENKGVISYIEENFKDLLETSQTPIKALSPIRTFWEKITLLHAENNRPQDKQLGDRMSRHYYDVYQMTLADIHHQALEDLSLLHDVISNNKKYFRSSWARYEEAVPGTMKITPNDNLLRHLETDYKSMASMIFGNIPSFSDVIGSIKKFEEEINLLSNYHGN
jgi:hypothetical protein